MNFKNFVLGVGIFVVFALVLWQGVELFYPSHEYNDFCAEFKTAEVIENAERCEAIGGKWSEDGIPRKPVLEGKTTVTGYCDRDYTCRMEWENAQDERSRVVFIIGLIVGVIALVVGYSVLSVEPVGSALIASGIWSVFWGTAINWRNFGDAWRFILLLLALVLLIWFAMRLNKPKKGKK